MQKYLTKGLISKDVNAFARKLSKECGACVFFLGRVREDKNKNKRVLRIEYSSYGKMAEKILERIHKALMKKYKLERLVMRHRLGLVNAGGISLLVSAGASHRKEALKAVEEAVGRIKKEVPIWKKEIYSDGSYRWVS